MVFFNYVSSQHILLWFHKWTRSPKYFFTNMRGRLIVLSTVLVFFLWYPRQPQVSGVINLYHTAQKIHFVKELKEIFAQTGLQPLSWGFKQFWQQQVGSQQHRRSSLSTENWLPAALLKINYNTAVITRETVHWIQHSIKTWHFSRRTDIWKQYQPNFPFFSMQKSYKMLELSCNLLNWLTWLM